MNSKKHTGRRQRKLNRIIEIIEKSLENDEPYEPKLNKEANY